MNPYMMPFKKILSTLSLSYILLTNIHGQKTEVVAGVTWDLANERAQNISGLAYQLFFDIPAEKSAPIPAKVDISLNLKHKTQPLLLDFKVSRENLQKVTVNKKIVPIDFVAGHLIIDPIHLNVGENKIQIEFIAGVRAVFCADSFWKNLDSGDFRKVAKFLGIGFGAFPEAVAR